MSGAGNTDSMRRAGMPRPARAVMLERWDEVDALFREVLDRPEAERRAFLLLSCAEDRELFETVSALVEAAESEPEQLVGPGEALLLAALTDPVVEDLSLGPLAPGDTVGRYRLGRELGRGGMATVYEAERSDGAFQRTVAIKMLRGVDTDELGRRFAAERQILSSLNHPNIARLLDGGTTPEGRPFLVMELVDGESITRWADAHSLGISERIELFLEVAKAVHYAHTRLVVHRDITPSNVLVAREERAVKLLDFGIAKLLDAGVDHAPETRAFTRWMTPSYASPEQVLGQPVTTATDVYALGVLLYELFTGQRPFDHRGRSDFELGRTICEEVPSLPSSAVTAVGKRPPADSGPGRPTPEAIASARGTTPQRLRRELEGDLDAIVAKALRKNPEDRFPSVQAMLDDLERYRTGFPVRAREGMRVYRARKFVARHRLAVAAAAVVGATMMGSSVVLAVQQGQTERERDRATEAAALATLEAEKARLVLGFLADVFRGRNPREAPSDTITARELLAWGTERVESEFSDRPEIQGELYAVMGGAHFNLGLLDEGIVLLERAVETLGRAHGEGSEEVAAALVRLAATHRTNRDFSMAVPRYEEALEIRRTLFGPDDERVAEVFMGLGSALRDLEQPDSAEVLLREAVRIGEGIDAGGPTAVQAALGLAYVLRGQGRLEESEQLYQDAIPRALAMPEIEAGDMAVHVNNLAYLRRLREDYDGAQALYGHALGISEDLYGRGHPTSLLIAMNRASALNLLGRTEEALELLDENVQAASSQWPEGHWRVGSAHMALGRALLQAGRPEEAQGSLLAGVRSYGEQLGAEHAWTEFAATEYRIAQILADDDPEARKALDSAYDYLRNSRDEAGGLLQPHLVQLLEPIVQLLESTGLDADAHRFRLLLPEGG